MLRLSQRRSGRFRASGNGSRQSGAGANGRRVEAEGGSRTERMRRREDALKVGINVRERLEQFVARRVEDPHDAEDILQEIFLRLLANVDRIDRSERVVPWLFQVARNAIADHYRTRSRRREIARAVEQDSASYDVIQREIVPTGHDTDQAHRELAACIRPMLEHLPEPYREALDLVDLSGWTQAAAADEVGLSRSGMKSRVQRGRRMLLDRLLDCCRVTRSAAGTIVEYEARGAHRCGRRGCCTHE